MFKNIQFLFIGKFKGYKHINLKQMVHDQGGTCVVNCSGNTNYVVLPNDLGSGEKYANNQQISIAQKKGKPIVHLSFLLDCLNQKKTVPFQDHLVEEFKSSVVATEGDPPDGARTEMDYSPYAQYPPPESADDGASAVDPGFYAGGAAPAAAYPPNGFSPPTMGFGFPKDFKVWKEYAHQDGRKYYFNILTGLTQWDRPPNFDEQAITSDEELRQQTEMVQQYQRMLQQYSTQYHQIIQQHSSMAGAPQSANPQMLAMMQQRSLQAQQQAAVASQQQQQSQQQLAAQQQAAQQSVTQQQQQQYQQFYQQQQTAYMQQMAARQQADMAGAAAPNAPQVADGLPAAGQTLPVPVLPGVEVGVKRERLVEGDPHAEGPDTKRRKLE